MVQAAAQAQAVVAAAKNRGGGLVPMNAAQISALSQIQAQAIVNARPQTALVGGTPGKTDEKPTPQQIQNQIQLQAQALVHAHTQAQIAAGIYKGGDPATSPATKVAAKPGVAVAAATAKASDGNASQQIKPPPQNELKPTSTPYSGVLAKGSAATQSAAAAAAAAVPQPMELSPSAPGASFMSDNLLLGENGEVGGVVMDPTSEEFLNKLNEALTEFWTEQLDEMKKLGTDKVETEQDFKNHNDLPLARIKRIMKSDEDVRMISAEAPVLFAKACEMFILEMTVRSWHYSENNKRKTLQKEDIREAIQRTDIFDFLVDVIH
jgi:nuclear transcription factor Y gamma